VFVHRVHVWKIPAEHQRATQRVEVVVSKFDAERQLLQTRTLDFDAFQHVRASCVRGVVASLLTLRC
jgi:hypothetical protein